jgi:cyclase
MANLRVIARLDVKGKNLIKGVRLEGLRKMGDPQEFAQRYYRQGIDELIYMDAVASLYQRNNLTEIVRRSAEDVFIPITVGGGVRSLEDARALLRAGADKVAINTAATKQPEILSELAQRFGSQCVVLSIEAVRNPGGQGWEAHTDNGREHTGLDVVEWAARGVELGAGEILLTSVDREGTGKGFDVELINAVSKAVSVPVIASGGFGAITHLVEAAKIGGADAVAIADALHFNKLDVQAIKKGAAEAGLPVQFHA